MALLAPMTGKVLSYIFSFLQAGKLGVVLFQFHNSFSPTVANRAHVTWCRERLQAHIRMAVEFRHRGWFDSQTALQETKVPALVPLLLRALVLETA